MFISYIFGTVGTGKSKHLYDSVYLSKKYHLEAIVIRPNIPNVYDNPKEIRAGRKKIYFENIFYYPGTLKISKNTSPIFVQHSHLFDFDDLKKLFMFFRSKWTYSSLVLFFGLEKNYKDEVYPHHKFLIENADYVEKYVTYCSSCREYKATHNQALYHGKEAPILPKQFETKIVYEPRCSFCYIHPEQVSEF